MQKRCWEIVSKHVFDEKIQKDTCWSRKRFLTSSRSGRGRQQFHTKVCVLTKNKNIPNQSAHKNTQEPQSASPGAKGINN